jgi:hypothetical protein
MKKTKKNDEELLAKIIKSSELSATKQRLGLFSMPVPLAVGARTFKPKKAKKDADGKVITKKRGIYTGCNRKGNLPKDLFDGSTHLTNGKYPDPYFQTGAFSRFSRSVPKHNSKRKSQSLRKPVHKDPFYLSTSKWGLYQGDRKKRFGNPYEFVSNIKRTKKRKIKDADGKVIVGKREGCNDYREAGSVYREPQESNQRPAFRRSLPFTYECSQEEC